MTPSGLKKPKRSGMRRLKNLRKWKKQKNVAGKQQEKQ